ncbi:MAG: DUF4328 domain-containing protein [Campylobacteraceae bacterium]|nr:DUF4328 domain-containing protein [Campylobacteraceae bacterium]
MESRAEKSKRLTSNKTMAKIAIFFSWSFLVVYLVIAIDNYYFRWLNEAADTNAYLNAGVLVTVAISLICVLWLIATVVIFIVWFYKAYSNLRKVTDKPKYAPYWAVWSWIIPVVNFYLPFKILKDMQAKASDLLGVPVIENTKNRKIINILWALYLIAWGLDIVYYIIIYPNSSIIFDVATFVLLIPSVWLSVKIIYNYSVLEERLFEKSREIRA